MNIELVSVWNQFENSYLKSLFWPEVDYDYAWIGLYYDHVIKSHVLQLPYLNGFNMSLPNIMKHSYPIGAGTCELI